MKKMVYVIIGLMALVFLVNLSAVSKNESTITLSDKDGFVQINPLY